MTGPKADATRAVPPLWTENNTTRIKTVSGTTKCSSAGAASLRPSTADSTEIAGVIMESPMNIDAPMTPSPSNGQLLRPSARCPSAISESVPPSPLLSARSNSSTYLAVTTMNSAHRIRDRTPSTMIRVIGWPCAAAVAASRNAYSGDVPISPKTTPMLPSVRAQKLVVTGPSWASVVVTLIAMMVEDALSVDLIPAGYPRFTGKPVNRSTITPRAMADLLQRGFILELRGNIVAQPNYGLSPGGSGGSSRISVMVTRRLADSEGSSGNSGWLSAFPETAKICEDGSPSRSRIWRTAFARSADRSNAP